MKTDEGSGIWRLVNITQKVLRIDGYMKDSGQYLVSSITSCGIRQIISDMYLGLNTRTLDHYFTNPSCPTEKELLMLSMLEPEIHKQIVKILEENNEHS